MFRKGSAWIGLIFASLATSAFTMQSSPVLAGVGNWVALGIVLLIILVIAILVILQSRQSVSAAARYHLDHTEHHDEEAAQAAELSATSLEAPETVSENLAEEENASYAEPAGTVETESEVETKTTLPDAELPTESSSEFQPAVVEPEPAKADDLTRIEGIGPKIAEVLNQVGIWSYSQLANSDVDTLKAALDNAGPQYSLADPATWPKQAGYLAEGNVEKFNALAERLRGGRKE